MRRAVALLAPLLLMASLPGCGLHPLYAGGTSGPVSQTLRDVAIGPIDGQAGFLMRNALAARLSANGSGGGVGRYQLSVELDDKITGLAINSANSVTRERRALRARFKLVDTENQGLTVLDATAGSDAGIDVVSSDYATLAAEQSALENLVQDIADQIVARLALYARRTHAAH